ncbi:zinc-finger domain-containing protein [Heyndrickxia ginsengihumi]
MERKQLLQEVNELLSTYCDGCFLKTYFRKEYGKKMLINFA